MRLMDDQGVVGWVLGFARRWHKKLSPEENSQKKKKILREAKPREKCRASLVCENAIFVLSF